MSRVVAGTTVGRWVAFLATAGVVVLIDQATKAWVVANYPLGEPVQVIGDWVRIRYIQNTGALFGLFQQQALLFGLVSLVVIGAILWMHARLSGTGGWLATVGLGLLLGGAVGNMIDRFRYGYVVDFVDLGIGDWRFFTFNVADACIDIGILVLIVLAFVPAIGERFGGRPGGEGTGPGAGQPADGPAEGGAAR